MTGSSDTTNPNAESVRQHEYVGDLKFMACDFDLSSLPDNEETASDAVKTIVNIRFTALLLRMDDEELSESVQKEPEAFMELQDCLISSLETKRQEVQILQTGIARLQIALERCAGEEVFCATG